MVNVHATVLVTTDDGLTAFLPYDTRDKRRKRPKLCSITHLQLLAVEATTNLNKQATTWLPDAVCAL